MNFNIDNSLLDFRAEIKKFLEKNLDPALIGRPLEFRSRRESIIAWQKILYQNNLGGPYWDKSHGGTGWSVQQQIIFDEECNIAGAPTVDTFAHKLVGPVINNFGNPQQREEHIPGILQGNRLWCQGFSEPGSGSDLASLRCRGDLVDDHYVINGQKIWTSYAHQANWIFLLVRSGASENKRAAINFLLVNMKSPGILIKPLISIDNQHHLNEVFFDGVKVPVRNRLGNDGDGWKITKFLLNNEHASTAELPSLQGYLRRLKKIALEFKFGNEPLGSSHAFRLRIARFEGEVRAIETMVARVAAMEQVGDHSPSAQALGSMLKIRGTELLQAMSQFMVESLGDFGAISFFKDDHFISNDSIPLPDKIDDIAANSFFRRASTIYGGTSEIQRGIISSQYFKF